MAVPAPPPGLGPRRSCLTSQLRKTKICIYHLRGSCQYGADCAFAHSCAEVQAAPDLRKTRLCRAFEAGKCSDAKCSFAHGERELRSTNLVYKTSMCIWNEKGKCRNGDQCRFAHGSTELRPGQVGRPKQQPMPVIAANYWVSTANEPMKVQTGVCLVKEPPKALPDMLLSSPLTPEVLHPMLAGVFAASRQQLAGNSPPAALQAELAKLRENVSRLTQKCAQIQLQMQGRGINPTMPANTIFDDVSGAMIEKCLSQMGGYAPVGFPASRPLLGGPWPASYSS